MPLLPNQAPSFNCQHFCGGDCMKIGMQNNHVADANQTRCSRKQPLTTYGLVLLLYRSAPTWQTRRCGFIHLQNPIEVFSSVKRALRYTETG